MIVNYANFALFTIGFFVSLSTMVTARKKITYDPLKGTYLASFQDPSGGFNCSIYFVDQAMFSIDGCNSSTPFVRGLNFTFSDAPVPRVVYTSFGVLLEVEDVGWLSYNDSLVLNITSNIYPEFFRNISLPEINFSHSDFGVPRIRGLPKFYGKHVTSLKTTVVMNTKMIILFYFNFDNYFNCRSYFWVGKGDRPDRNGRMIPDERGRMDPIENYEKKTIVLKLPRMNASDPTSPEMTIYDFDYLSIYCPDTQRVYGSINTVVHYDEYNRVKINPPFIFNRFFLGEDILLCLPNGTYSREVNFDGTKSVRPCLGGSSSLLVTHLHKLCLFSSTVVVLLLQSKSFGILF